MAVQLELNFEQVKKLIKQLGETEKEKLAEYLDDITLFAQWETFKKRKKNILLNINEITKEVEAVRGKRYNS